MKNIGNEATIAARASRLALSSWFSRRGISALAPVHPNWDEDPIDVERHAHVSEPK